MILIEITSNDLVRHTNRFIVSNGMFGKLEDLAYIGGYKRFDIDVWGYVKERKDAIDEIAEWLNNNVFFSNYHEVFSMLN